MLYDIPFRTGRKLDTATILRLASGHPNVVAVKDAAGDVAESASLVAQAPDGFELYSGEDKLNLPLLAIGAVGFVGVASHWAAPETRALFDAWERGDVAEARRIDQLLRPSYAYESSDAAPNPVPTKAMLRTLGLPAGVTRPPLGPVPDGLEDRARQVYADLKSASIT
jgi:4-hydroxy-tetrahydrodipicolinate synthase